MAIEYKTVTYRTVESANDNATYCWVELSASHVPSVNGVIKRIVIQGATNGTTGFTTDPMYLGLWERQDDGGLISLGCSKNAVTQALNQENTWDFDGAIVSGKSLLLGLLSSPDEHWTNNTDLLLRSRVQTNDTDGCVILTNIGRLRVTPDITFTVEYPEYVPDADPEPEPEPEPESEQRVIDISKYWIPIIRKTTNFQQIAAAENPEFNLLVEKLNALEKDGFIPTATEYGVKRWEQILGLVASDGMTLDERKAQILNYLNVKTAYTIRTLRQMLAAIVGEGNYTMHIDNDTQTLHLAFTSEVWNTKMNEVESLLKRVLPMNLDIKFDPLPLDFVELEYLESSGTQYIVTNEPFVGKQTGIRIIGTQVSGGGYLWGVRPSHSNYIQLGGDVYEMTLAHLPYRILRLSSGGGVKCEAAYNFKSDKKMVLFKTEQSSEKLEAEIGDTWTYPTTDLPMMIFGMIHTTHGHRPFGRTRIYSFMVSQGSEITCDLVPYLDANGVPCMYDKVSGEFFYNAGTGTFGYRLKTSGETVAPFSLRDPYYTAPSGIYARLIAENELDIIADTDMEWDAAEQYGYTWFANTGEAYVHFNIEEVIENE